MKILCIGAGSMGRRRLRDLTYLSRGDILHCEKSEERCTQAAAAFGVPGFTNLEEALSQSPDVVTVSTPPSLHEEPVRQAMKIGAHIFAEVPFFLDLKSMRELARQAAGYPAVLAASHSFRMYPPVRLIRELITSGAIGAPLYFEHSLGNHVAAWHAYERYQDFYAGDIRMGGAGMDMLPHDFLGIQWWMGKVESVYARLSKVSGLEVNGPDVHDVLLTFDSGAKGFFHNDIIEHGTVGRHVRIAGETGTIEWRQDQPGLRLYQAGRKVNETLGFDRARDWNAAVEASSEMFEILAKQRIASGQPPAPVLTNFTYESCYLREIRHFLDAVEGKLLYDDYVTLDEELHNVEIYHAVLRSSETGQEVRIREVGK